MLICIVTYIHLHTSKIFPTLWIFPHLTVAGGSWTRPSVHPPSPIYSQSSGRRPIGSWAGSQRALKGL